MFVNIASKTTTVRFKIFTEAGFRRIVGLFQQLEANARTVFAGDTVEMLYEIRIGAEFYSGPSQAEFQRLYERDHEADYVRLSLHVTNPQQQANQTQQQRSEAVLNLVLDRSVGAKSGFDIGGKQQYLTWLNGAAARLEEILASLPRRNVILHSKIYEMLVQILAVFLIVVFSVFAANKLMHVVKLEYSEVYVFIVVMLLLSNVWTYVSQALIQLRNRYYPIVDIRRAPRKPVLFSVLAFVGLATATWAVEYVLNVLIR